MVPRPRGTSAIMCGVRIGLADHFGWAIAVTAADDHRVVDRRRIALVEPGVPEAPFHHGSKRLDVAATELLVEEVEASARRAVAAAFEGLAAGLPGPVAGVCVRAVPSGFPTDVAVLVEVPWEARADGVLYRRALTEVARGRGWDVHHYDHRTVGSEAAALLGDRADEVLHGPRTTLGPPWTKDHRMALAATILAADASRHAPT
jgi:hypothetical protein